MKFLFLFLDGVGLGSDNPAINPFAGADMPVLESLLGGRRLLLSTSPSANGRATLVPLDACLGIAGLPQSATGQATLLTGQNIPGVIGHHYGPKPNPPIAGLLCRKNIFYTLKENGFQAAFLNAYPPRYFEAIQSGRRIYSAIPLAVTCAGLGLKNRLDYYAGQAISADFTGQGWREQLGFADAPVLEYRQAGQRMAELARSCDFSFFEFWISDYAGHHQDMEQARHILQSFDQVLGGLIEAWDDRDGLVLITSDHGNLEDLSTRRHTPNPVPALLIGGSEYRQAFTTHLHNLADVTPAILRFYNISAS
ncbi:MAG: alkaline phosphatase family protein [Omnitrophica WOR_2 bacterium]